MPLTFSAIEIVVADMATSLAFYRRLGLDLPAAAETEAHVEHVLPGGFKVMWDSADMIASFSPDWTAPTGTPRMSLASSAAARPRSTGRTRP